MPLISVILPTRDRLESLPRAIESVLAQTEGDFELLVVANGPAAEESSLVERVGLAPDPRVRVLHAPLAGNAGMARNVGLAAAAGEWVTFLDDDDAYRPGKLGRQLALARATRLPFVLCGACVHLRGRTRLVQCGGREWRDDELLLSARWNTPLLFHRRSAVVRFDEELFAGEDSHYAQRVIATLGVRSVGVECSPLVDIYQDLRTAPRTNLQADAGWRAARRVWWQFGRRYSAAARRLFVLRALITRAKLQRRTFRCVELAPALLRAGGVAQLRFVLNAVAVSVAGPRGRFVS